MGMVDESGSMAGQWENGTMSPIEPIVLNAAEARALGALMEKEITIPDHYPLSVNALMNACNQRSNREPVMDLSEDDVRDALNGLQEHRLAGSARGADSRVTKYEHWLGEAFNFSRAESALLCVLLLRGAQTPGELRGRTERMHKFEEIGDVLAGLQKLMEREPPLVAVLARQPGTKEARYAHLLLGEVAASAAGDATRNDSRSETSGAEFEERVAQLESAMTELRNELTMLKEKLGSLLD
jgi:uncharacterized protein YceH (UPF0502 family)